jgi:hypothetical protein
VGLGAELIWDPENPQSGGIGNPAEPRRLEHEVSVLNCGQALDVLYMNIKERLAVARDADIVCDVVVLEEVKIVIEGLINEVRSDFDSQGRLVHLKAVHPRLDSHKHGIVLH